MNGNVKLKVHIKHMKAVSYERNEAFDLETSTGQFQVRSLTNEQGTNSQVFWSGSEGYGGVTQGVSMQQLLTAYALNTAQFLKIKSTFMRAKLMNATTGLIKSRVYVLKAVRDVPTGTGTTTDPHNVWQEITSERDVGSVPVTVIGSTPYIAGFGATWKIIKNKTVVLNPGQTVDVHIDTDEHYKLSHLKYGSGIEASQGNYLVRGRTYALMVVNNGYPVGSIGTSEETFVAIGPTLMNVTWTFGIRVSVFVKSICNRGTLANTRNPLSAIATGNQVEVNDDDGLVRAHAIAD